MELEKDTDTGLPKVPEGYFWRVCQSMLGVDKLQLRKKTWYGSRKIDERMLQFYYKDSRTVMPPQESILWSAEAISKEADFNDPWTAFRGDYPPKKV